MVLVELKSLLVEFATVLDRFKETVGRVDGTVGEVCVITAQLGEVVGEMGGIAQRVSPAFALNDEFRRQLDRLRSLPGGAQDDTAPQA
jgi:hypothetical protein